MRELAAILPGRGRPVEAPDRLGRQVATVHVRLAMGAGDTYAAARAALLEVIARQAEETARFTGRRAFAPAVMQAMARGPREEFVPDALRDAAYRDGPLPIGHRQTISQPYIVALMTDLLDPGPDDVVLEVGSGSGYQAAVLSRLVRQVYGIEVIDELAQRAREVLQRLGCANVELRCGDGNRGWPERAPFDGILVAAAAPLVPAALFEQLRPGGRLVAPVGQPHGEQELRRYVKDSDGVVHEQPVLPVAFVPLVQP
jgi:protein-L-isoaspartate(D-aspartate) O-methyltransferase